MKQGMKGFIGGVMVIGFLGIAAFVMGIGFLFFPEPKSHDPQAYTTLKILFEKEEQVAVLCYWGKKDYRINDVFYGEYYDEQQDTMRLGFFDPSSHSSLGLSKKEVYRQAGLTEKEFHTLTEKMNEQAFSCLDKRGETMEFIYGGMLDNYSGVFYSPLKPKKHSDYYFVDPLGGGWYYFDHT